MAHTVSPLRYHDNIRESDIVSDENQNLNSLGLKQAPVKPKKTFSVSVSNEAEYRRKCTTLSILDWTRQSTPKRRDLFKQAKVSLRSSDNKWSHVPKLAVISGITHSTWNKSIQALFSTQNCDAMFSLGVGVLYFQRILRAITASPSDVLVVDQESIPLDGAIARNMLFAVSNILAMKYCDDLHLSNNYLSRVFKIPLSHVNIWEKFALEKLDWRLGYTEAERIQIMLELSSHIEA